jgi:hypothetical protein
MVPHDVPGRTLGRLEEAFGVLSSGLEPFRYVRIVDLKRFFFH